MATAVYRVLGQVAPTGTSETTLLTVGAGKSQVTSTLAIANITTTVCLAEVNVRPAGAALANQHRIIKGASLGPGESLFLTLGLTLAATDVVSVKTDTANGLAFSLFGTEIS